MRSWLRRLARCRALAAGLALWSTQALAEAALPVEVVGSVRKAFGDGELRTMSGSVDLDGDDRPELLVYVVGSTTCGTGGCPLLVFTRAPGGWRLVSTIGPSQTPVGVASRSSSGWRDLVVRIGGGGAASAGMTLSFDGMSYPANPTVRSARVKLAADGGQPVIAEQQSIDDAQPLPAASPTAGAAASAAAAPSFDCAKASARAEKMVCGDPGLAALDRAVAQAYGTALSPQSRWTDKDKVGVRRAQRAWIAERNTCGQATHAAKCIAESYRRRLVELKIALGDAGAVPSAVAYRCEGTANLTVTATYYRQLDPRAAVVTVGDKQAVAFAAPSGSGAKYTTKDVVLWEHQGEAMLTWFGTRYTCRVN